MPERTVPGTTLSYHLINHDSEGREVREPDGTYLSHALVNTIAESWTRASERITDVFVMSHGWKGDVNAAIEQYDQWSAAMAACEGDRARVRVRWPDFKPLLIGFHWPSLPWGEEPNADGSFAAEPIGGEDQFIEVWGDRIASSDAARAALRVLFRSAQEDIEPDLLPPDVVEAYRVLEREAGLRADGVSGAPDADREVLNPQQAYEDWRDVDDAVSFAGGFMGGLLSPLRQLSFWTMKKRARAVGESGGHRLLERIADASKNAVRIHLMGHSFGCIVTSGMIRGDDAHGIPVSSVLLVQGAMSLWSFSQGLPKRSGSGYFRPVVDPARVQGALVVTTSRFDRAVGMLYPKAAGVAMQVAFDTAPSKELPTYGAIGAYGIQGDGLPLAAREISTDLTFDYAFSPGHVYNVRCDSVIKTGGGLSGAHSDIAHPEVGHLFWEAVLSTP